GGEFRAQRSGRNGAQRRLIDGVPIALTVDATGNGDAQRLARLVASFGQQGLDGDQLIGQRRTGVRRLLQAAGDDAVLDLGNGGLGAAEIDGETIKAHLAPRMASANQEVTCSSRVSALPTVTASAPAAMAAAASSGVLKRPSAMTKPP